MSQWVLTLLKFSIYCLLLKINKNQIKIVLHRYSQSSELCWDTNMKKLFLKLTEIAVCFALTVLLIVGTAKGKITPIVGLLICGVINIIAFTLLIKE